MTPSNLQELLDQSGNTVELLRNSQIGAYVYPVVPSSSPTGAASSAPGARRAVLFDQSHHMANLFMRGPDAIKLISDTGDQQRGQLPRRTWPSSSCRARPTGTSSATASSSTSTRRSSCSSAARPSANWLRYHGETGGYERRDREGRPLARRARTARPCSRKYWRFQIQGPNAWQVIEKLNGGPVEQLKFFRMADDEHRRPAGAHAAPRHGRRARPRALGPLRELRRGPRRDPRGRPGVRHASRAARAPMRPTRSSRAGSRRRCRPSTPARSCAATASGCRADGYEATNALAGQLRLRRHRGLLPEPVGARLRPRSSSSTTTSSAATRSRRSTPSRAAQEGDAGLERRGRGQDLRLDVRHRRAAATSSSTCRSPTTARRTSTRVLDADGEVVGFSMFTGYSANEQRGAVAGHGRPGDRDRHRADGRLGRAGRRHRARRPSSPTSSSTCAPSSARCPTRSPRAPSTRRAGAPPPPTDARCCPAPWVTDGGSLVERLVTWSCSTESRASCPGHRSGGRSRCRAPGRRRRGSRSGHGVRRSAWRAPVFLAPHEVTSVPGSACWASSTARVSILPSLAL